jgi:hypothetical protein
MKKICLKKLKIPPRKIKKMKITNKIMKIILRVHNKMNKNLL